jgi:LysM repeat protein
MRQIKKFLLAVQAAFLIVFFQGAAPSFGQEFPPEAYVSDLIGHAQLYNLSCESRSAVDWAAYWGVVLDETEVVYGLPRTDNPETGFVGDPNGGWGAIPPASYGVHAGPIAEALRGYGLPAEARSGMTWDELRGELAAGKPVIIWVIGQMWAGSPISYTGSDGQTVVVARFEHSMIAIGYGEGAYGPVVHVVDAYSGFTQTYSQETFLASWSVLGNQAVVSTGPAPEPAVEADLVPGGSYTVQAGDTLSGVAQEFGVAWPDLAALNQLSYPYILYTGQILQVPSAGDGFATLPDSEADSEPEPGPTPEPAELPVETPVEPETVPSLNPEDVSAEVEQNPQAQPLEHIVQVGDSLTGIANRYQVTWQALAEANQLAHPYFLYPDQCLYLPEGALAPAEASAAVEAVQPAEAEPGSEQTYVVQRGEYLIGLAERFGLMWQELAEQNGIGYPYVVYAGQVLRLP